MTVDSITHCIYHFPCFDGFAASYLVWYERGEAVEYIPKNYNENIPDLPEDAHVLMVDVSWSREELLALNEQVASLVVLDHHKTAQEELEGLDFAIFDMERSGAGITWDWMHEGVERPPLVNYVEDRDLWRFDLKDSKIIHAYLSSLPWEYHEWATVDYNLDLGGKRREEILESGKAIRRYQEKRYREVADLFHMVYIGGASDGYSIPAANVGLAQFKSGGIHEFLNQNPEVMVAATYGIGPDGNYYWSLRSQNGFDCSEIAKDFDGGGHPQASGFSTKHPPTYLGPIEEWLL